MTSGNASASTSRPPQGRVHQFLARAIGMIRKRRLSYL